MSRRTIYRTCSCGETAHDAAGYSATGDDVFRCRNCGNARTAPRVEVEAQPLLDALAAAGITVRAMADTFYRVEGTRPALVTVSVRSNGYRVAYLLGKRWRTAGTWLRPAKVVAEVQRWVTRNAEVRAALGLADGASDVDVTGALAGAHAQLRASR